jgi:hypothetical protein
MKLLHLSVRLIMIISLNYKANVLRYQFLYIETQDKIAFRAVRNALYQLKDKVVGVLTDTNSNISDLAPSAKEDTDSVSVIF